MKTSIIITLQMEGFHRWYGAPDEMDFLRDRHRHMFHFKIVKQVFHADRDIEIILMKRAVVKHLSFIYGSRTTSALEFDGMSCEHICIALLEKFDADSVEVTEDGENGAIVCKE